ncbi:putative quinol monooxygenase [Streptomyces hydrogenans]|uniref:putative quinol monooxygenase n=1 Tax=Streptomyces hydrogenans TaxID=1873719 RepID=UPI0037FAA85C
MAVTAGIDSSRPVATLINVFTVPPERRRELLALLARATETTMKHRPGFLCADFHASRDGRRVINYAQWETEDHYRAMRADPEAQVHMDEAATIATDVQPRLFTVASPPGRDRCPSPRPEDGHGRDGRPVPVARPTTAVPGRGAGRLTRRPVRTRAAGRSRGVRRDRGGWRR